MKQLKKAFTLTELLVALGVIAVLCAILLPIAYNKMPNQNTIMAKRAYYTVQTIVSDLINDARCYPDTTGMTESYTGFDDKTYYDSCTKLPSASSGGANEKFATLFYDKLGIEATDINPTSWYQTKDGMCWSLAYNTGNGFSDGENGSQRVTIAVNSKNNGKECKNADINIPDDKLVVIINADGGLTLDEIKGKLADAVSLTKGIADD